MGSDQRGHVPRLRCLPAQRDQLLGLGMGPALQLAPLLRTLATRADAVDDRRPWRKRLARAEAAGEHHVPAGRAVPAIDVGVLGQGLQLRQRGLGRSVARERKGSRDRIQDQLRDLARGRFALGEIGPERPEQRAREGLLRTAHPAISLPAMNVAAAAIAPTSTVSRPLRSQGRPISERPEQRAREGLLRTAHPAISLPAMNVAAAAIAPTSTVSRPLRSQGRPVIQVLAAPAANSATSVHPTESAKAVETWTGRA